MQEKLKKKLFDKVVDKSEIMKMAVNQNSLHEKRAEELQNVSLNRRTVRKLRQDTMCQILDVPPFKAIQLDKILNKKEYDREINLNVRIKELSEELKTVEAFLTKI